MDPSILEVSDLSKTYADGTAALQGASFQIDGGVCGLLGENGAGKSTTLSILALQQRPTSGTVRHQGLDAGRARNRPAILRRLGYLPQAFEPVPSLTGWEYLEHCARLRGVATSARGLRERIGELLEAVDLIAWAHRPSHEYSGGMKRRLGVCQAMVHDPDFVILDEPSAGLDPEQRILLRNFIAEAGRQRTILLSSHVVDDIDQTCRRMIVLSAGTVLYTGSPSELLRRFSSHLWELAAPDPAEPAPEAAGPEGAPLPAGTHLLGFIGDRAHVVYAAIRPVGARPRRPNLEEAYGALLVDSRPASPR